MAHDNLFQGIGSSRQHHRNDAYGNHQSSGVLKITTPERIIGGHGLGIRMQSAFRNIQ